MTITQLKEKIALGTAQLGLPYGINNKTGKPNREEAFSILRKALSHNIGMLDSADAYGNSTQVIGDFLKAFPETNFHIISKFIIEGKSLEEKFSAGVKVLNRTSLYAYMYHRFEDYIMKLGKSALVKLKQEGKIEKIGVSVYGTEQLRIIVNDPDIDLIQIPFNLFDISADKTDLLKKAKSLRKEIHVRSIFLQGLFFKKPHELTGNLIGLSKPLQVLHEIFESNNLTVMQACLNHALHNRFIDYVIIGVETSSQLDQNLNSLLPDFPSEILEQLKSIDIADNTLLNPTNWEP